MNISSQSLKRGLLLSLMLNIFLIGFLFSSCLHGPRDGKRPPHMQGPFQSFEQAKRNVSEDGKKIIDRILHQQSIQLRDQTDGMKQSFHDAKRILLAETFNKDELKEVHDKMDSSSAAMKSEMSNMIYEIATQLSSEDRVAFFKKALPRPPKNK